MQGGMSAINCSNYRGVYSFHSAGANGAFADGSVRLLGREMSPTVFFAFVTARGGELPPQESGARDGGPSTSRDGPGGFAVSRCSTLFLLTLAGGVALGLTLCRRGDRETVFPVTGKVVYHGKPAEGATVTFVPGDGSDPQARRPGAQVGQDGSFRLSTYVSYDGAPAGRYAVMIIYPSPERKENGENAGPDLLLGRYADPKTTPLAVEVKEGTNNLEPFELQ